MYLDRHKYLVYVIIGSTVVPLALALDWSKLNLSWDLFAFVARLSGLTGTLFIWWEYILTARGITSRFMQDTGWITHLHKKLGHLGFYLILLHFVGITVYYAQVRGINLINFVFETPAQFYKNMGILGLLLLLALVISSITLRKRLNFRDWHKIHVTSYLILPLALLHNIGIGRSDVAVPATVYWYILFFLYICFIIYAWLFSRGKLKLEYEVQLVDTEAVRVVNIHLAPTTKRISPQPGQYIYLQRKNSLESHPFSVSKFDPITGVISIAPKALGPFSNLLQHMQAGENVWIDGPYGTFGAEIFSTRRPIVLLAGGIGIVPFMPTIYKLGEGMQKEVHLIYGNNSDAEIAFYDEIAGEAAKTQFLHVHHVIKDTANKDFIPGFITEPVLHQCLGEDLNKYEYFVCGPPPMISAMQGLLTAARIPHPQIHFEEFSA